MGNINVGRITLGMCQTNTYYLYKTGSDRCIVIDPADRGKDLTETIKQKGLSIGAILLTHGHFDHIFGIDEMKEETGAEVYACYDEAELLKDPLLNCSQDVGRSCSVVCDKYLKDKDIINLCDITLEMIATPGHTKGGCCYYIEEDKILMSGDTLFCESVGRADLPTGSMKTLIHSIKDKLMILPDETVVYPGHGMETTIGYERDNNPFL